MRPENTVLKDYKHEYCENYNESGDEGVVQQIWPLFDISNNGRGQFSIDRTLLSQLL